MYVLQSVFLYRDCLLFEIKTFLQVIVRPGYFLIDIKWQM